MAQITVANAGTVFACEDDTIMRAAVRAGLGFPYECNAGSCGTCRFELIEGQVVHERANSPAWGERDRQRNRYLGCQTRPLSDCKIKVYLGDQYKSLRPPKRVEARLFETEDITHDMREFRFRLSEPAPFLAGQYALLRIPGVEGTRAYSICNIPDPGEEWHFQIKRVPGGSATERLFGSVGVGQVISVDGPYGTAYLREAAPRDILCLAGGSGLSPMISIARTAAQSPALADRTLHFIYGGRTARDICGESMLKCLPGYGRRIFYYAAVSAPESDPYSPPRKGRIGLLPDVAREVFGEHLADFEIYFAGSPAMAEAVIRMLVELRVPLNQVHYDRFY
jgi:toluene monooxygenase electron transfer component